MAPTASSEVPNSSPKTQKTIFSFMREHVTAISSVLTVSAALTYVAMSHPKEVGSTFRKFRRPSASKAMIEDAEAGIANATTQLNALRLDVAYRKMLKETRLNEAEQLLEDPEGSDIPPEPESISEAVKEASLILGLQTEHLAIAKEECDLAEFDEMNKHIDEAIKLGPLHSAQAGSVTYIIDRLIRKKHSKEAMELMEHVRTADIHCDAWFVLAGQLARDADLTFRNPDLAEKILEFVNVATPHQKRRKLMILGMIAAARGTFDVGTKYMTEAEQIDDEEDWESEMVIIRRLKTSYAKGKQMATNNPL
jgi:hypothetical protein